MMKFACIPISRALAALAVGAKYRLGSGPCEPHDLAEPWHWPESDCSSFATYCVGVAKHEAAHDGLPTIWWGTTAIYRDARSASPRRWREVAQSPEGMAPPGSVVVYPGHCGIVVGGTIERPETIESASSKGGLWRGFRPSRFWERKGAIFVAPKESK